MQNHIQIPHEVLSFLLHNITLCPTDSVFNTLSQISNHVDRIRWSEATATLAALQIDPQVSAAYVSESTPLWQLAVDDLEVVATSENNVEQYLVRIQVRSLNKRRPYFFSIFSTTDWESADRVANSIPNAQVSEYSDRCIQRGNDFYLPGDVDPMPSDHWVF